MKVLFVVLDDETRASTRYRVLNFIPYLESSGFETEVLSIHDVRGDLVSTTTVRNILKMIELQVQAGEYDLVFLQKLLPNPVFTGVLDWRANRLMFDLDDAIYTAPPWGTQHPRWERNLDTIVRRSDGVITGSPVLTAHVEEDSDHTYTLPTAIPKQPYDENQKATHSNNDGVLLGWIGNPENLHYLAASAEVIESVLDAYDHVGLRIITAGELPVTPLDHRRGDDVAYVEWSIESELQLLSEVDIGIRPLTDDEWTRAKGGFTSVVQCMGLGLPVVVTPVGMLEQIVADTETGRHATTEEEWMSALSELIENPAYREEMGSTAREALSEMGFWTEDRAAEFIDALQHCIRHSG